MWRVLWNAAILILAIAAEPAIADAIISDDWPAIIALSEKIASHQQIRH